MTKADFLAEQARQEERRRITIEKELLISSESGGSEDEGCCKQGQIDGIAKLRQSVYTQILIITLHPPNTSFRITRNGMTRSMKPCSETDR